jgi:hypothetical protein
VIDSGYVWQQLSHMKEGLNLEDSTRLLGLISLLLLCGLLLFAIYSQRKRQRALRITKWIRDYLSQNYGALVPDSLHINCSDDPLWPVIVRFTELKTGSRLCLQFASPESPKSIQVLSSVDETAR